MTSNEDLAEQLRNAVTLVREELKNLPENVFASNEPIDIDSRITALEVSVTALARELTNIATLLGEVGLKFTELTAKIDGE